jgi:hypothetical protein
MPVTVEGTGAGRLWCLLGVFGQSFAPNRLLVGSLRGGRAIPVTVEGAGAGAGAATAFNSLRLSLTVADFPRGGRPWNMVGKA